MARWYTRSQLRAISRSYTQRGQKKAIEELTSLGIDFDRFRELTGYKSSPVRLLTSIRNKESKTLKNIEQYKFCVSDKNWTMEEGR